MMVIKTGRLVMEPLSTADQDFILELVNTAGWKRFIGDRQINTPADALAYIHKITANDKFQYRVVKLLHSQEKAGIITLIQRDYLDHPDIGFAFLPRFEGQGYALEATRAVLQYLVQQSQLSCILATTLPDNHRSIQLLTKLGLHYQKDILIGTDTLLLYGAAMQALKLS